MFFHIAYDQDSVLDLEPLGLIKMGDTSVQLDKGWTSDETSDYIEFRKGYSIEHKLEDIDPEDATEGNYCIIRWNKSNKKCEIFSDAVRGYPVYKNKNFVSNLIQSNSFAENRNFKSIEDLPFLTMDEVVDRVEEDLTTYIKKAIAVNDFEFKMTSTGGIDSLTLMAILEHNNIPYTLAGHFAKGENLKSIKPHSLYTHIANQYWGYDQFYVTDNETVLTGFWGDEFLMRNAIGCYLYLLPYGIDYKEEILETECYQRDFVIDGYVNTNKFEKMKEHWDTNNPSKIEIANGFQHDYQMWGLDNTVAVVPYKQFDILQVSFQMSPEDALSHGLHATVQRKIIERRNPELLEQLQKNKNEF